MSDKPPKRLVGWKEYLHTNSRRSILNAGGIVLGCFGLVFLREMGVGIGRTLAYLLHLPADPLRHLSGSFGMIGGCCGVAVLTLWAGSRLFRKARALPSVQLLTQESARSCPPAETLVRPSDLPPSHQQAELLRATNLSKETPSEELLRATTTHSED